MYKPTITTLFVLILVVLVLQFLFLTFMLAHKLGTKKRHYKHPAKTTDTVCTKDTCGALDPVNEPAYNIQNVIKQSILLEEHIAEKNKYCKSCIIKHFLHIIGLLEEAVWLAGKTVQEYPLLEDSPIYYQRIFQAWMANTDDDTTKREALSLLRERRRALIEIYFLQNK